MSVNWKSLLGGIAPTIATALGGPAAGGLVKILSKTLLGHENASEDEVAAAVAGATPEQIEAIRKQENDYILTLLDRSVQMDRVEADDRASARNREVTAHDSWTLRILACLVIVGFLGVTFMVMSGRTVGIKDPAVIGTIGTLLGYLSAKADTVIGYYFGGSLGSRMKDAVIGRMNAGR